jgi:hypothetical protein
MTTHHMLESARTLTPSVRRRRGYRLQLALAGMVALAMFFAMNVLPWLSGIRSGAKHTYLPEISDQVRGVYLLTEQGVMLLYTWNMPLDNVPDDAPTLDATTLHTLTVVHKQFYPPESYLLYNLTANALIPWQATHQQDRQLVLDPGPLVPGDYLFIMPTMDMFGGESYHYFRLRD